jgi:endonuclease/exonuclease/phosphatase family metal-dependent hydrolase
MRVLAMAFNVHAFRAGTRRVAETLQEPRPDVLLLNETGYLGWALARFARRMGMSVASGLHGLRRIPNAVLVRPPWRIVEVRVLRFPRPHRTVRRGAVVATLGRAGIRLTAASVHLGLSAEERRRDARILTDALAGREPLILGGDLNEERDGEAAAWIAERYWDAFERAGDGEGFTFPASAPRARIDFLFVSDGIRIERARVGGTALTASDHLPIVADLEIDEPEPPRRDAP